MSKEMDDRGVECLNQADEATPKAESAPSPCEARFWLRMEQRWLHLAQTYRAGATLTAVGKHGSPKPNAN
jgi:hypothetical protein